MEKRCSAFHQTHRLLLKWYWQRQSMAVVSTKAIQIETGSFCPSPSFCTFPCMWKSESSIGTIYVLFKFVANCMGGHLPRELTGRLQVLLALRNFVRMKYHVERIRFMFGSNSFNGFSGFYFGMSFSVTYIWLKASYCNHWPVFSLDSAPLFLRVGRVPELAMFQMSPTIAKLAASTSDSALISARRSIDWLPSTSFWMKCPVANVIRAQ